MGQWLCVPMIFGGGALLALGFNRPELRPSQLAPSAAQWGLRGYAPKCLGGVDVGIFGDGFS